MTPGPTIPFLALKPNPNWEWWKFWEPKTIVEWSTDINDLKSPAPEAGEEKIQ